MRYCCSATLVVSGPVNGVQVETQLNLHAAGTIVTILNFNATEVANASGHVSLDVGVPGHTFDGDIDVMNHQNPAASHTTMTGLFAGFGGNGDITTPSFFVTTGVPFSIELRLGVEAGSFANIPGSSANNHYIVFSNTGAIPRSSGFRAIARCSTCRRDSRLIRQTAALSTIGLFLYPSPRRRCSWLSVL